jgi:hypothetical protein
LKQSYPCKNINWIRKKAYFVFFYSRIDTGFGSEEDSLNSTKKLLPDPVKKDFNRFMGFDR